MNIEHLQMIQDNIETMLTTSVDPTKPEEIRAKLTEISTLIGNAVMCVTEAKRRLISRKGEWLRKHHDKIKDMKPTQAKEFVNTALIDDEILFSRCESNYDALKKSGDLLQSVLSHHKAEMQAAQRL